MLSRSSMTTATKHLPEWVKGAIKPNAAKAAGLLVSLSEALRWSMSAGGMIFFSIMELQDELAQAKAP